MGSSNNKSDLAEAFREQDYVMTSSNFEDSHYGLIKVFSRK